MPSDLITIRDICADAIEAERVNPLTTYPYTGFVVAKEFDPKAPIEDLVAGNVSLICGLNDDDEVVSRASRMPCIRTMMVQVSIRRSGITRNHKTNVAEMIVLEECIRDTIRKGTFDASTALNIRFCKIESMKDSDGIPMCFYMLREGTVFETYFTAYFKKTLS